MSPNSQDTEAEDFYRIIQLQKQNEQKEKTLRKRRQAQKAKKQQLAQARRCRLEANPCVNAVTFIQKFFSFIRSE